MSSKILTDREVDEPIIQGAKFRYDKLDRAYIDEQARGAQQHLVENLINGFVATWYTVDENSQSVEVGDILCLAGSAVSAYYVTRAIPVAIANAGRGLGVALTAAAPMTDVRVAILGVLPPSITGLVPSDDRAIRVSTTARCEPVAAFSTGDYPIGYCDNVANLSLAGSVTTGDGGPLTGDAGGHLALTYPNPSLANGRTTKADLRALTLRSHRSEIHLAEDNKPWRYDTTTGANVADNGYDCIKPTDVLLASNGRWIGLGETEVPTIAALRTLTGGFSSRVSVRGFSSDDDGGGGKFIKRLGTPPSDDGGINIIPSGVTTFWYQRQYRGAVHAAWFGLREDAIFKTNAILVAGDATMTCASAAFTADDVGKQIILGVPAPGSEGTGTISTDTGTPTTIVGSGTSFLTDCYPGMAIAWKDADENTPAQSVGVATVKSIESDTSLTIWEGGIFHTKSGLTWFTTNQWQTTIAAVNSATSVELAEASAVRWTIGPDPVVRFVYGSDSLAALQAAIDATPEGGACEIQDGNFLFSDSIPLGDKSIELRGPSASWKNVGFVGFGGPENLTAASTTKGAVLQFGASHGIVTEGKCTIRDLCLVGPGSSGYHGVYMPEDPGGSIDVVVDNVFCPNWHRGIAASGAIDIKLRSVKAHGCGEAGIVLGERVDNPASGTIDVQISDPDIQGSGAGIKVIGCRRFSVGGTKGIVQSNLADVDLAPYDNDPGGGIGGISEGTFKGIYKENNVITLRFSPQDGILRDICFEDVTFGNQAGTVVMGTPGVYAVAGGFSFKRCSLGGIKFLFPATMTWAKVDWEGCNLPATTDRIVIEDPTKVSALRIDGADGFASGMPATGKLTVSGTVTPNFTAPYGSVQWHLLSGTTTYGAPTNAFLGAEITFVIERTTETVNWNAVYKNPPTLEDNQTSVVKWYTPDGTNWYLSGGPGAGGTAGSPGAPGKDGADATPDLQGPITIGGPTSVGFGGSRDVDLTASVTTILLNPDDEDRDVTIYNDGGAPLGASVEFVNVSGGAGFDLNLFIDGIGQIGVLKAAPSFGLAPGYCKVQFKTVGGSTFILVNPGNLEVTPP